MRGRDYIRMLRDEMGEDAVGYPTEAWPEQAQRIERAFSQEGRSVALATSVSIVGRIGHSHQESIVQTRPQDAMKIARHEVPHRDD